MNEATSDSSVAFERLARPIQRWVWDQRWTSLRDIQERAVAPILEGHDVVLASATASGKTEAAFLPILTRVADEVETSLKVLCVSPLKALINDQMRRLEPMLELLNAPVTRWHGDAEQGKKLRLLRDPRGLLLITPESIEALMVNRGTAIAGLFAELDYVVVDELHSFIGNERGCQLQSLLHRIEAAIGRRVPRVGLSATLGDMTLACEFLRPDAEEANVVLVESTAARRDVRLQIRGYEGVESDDGSDDEPDAFPLLDDLLGAVREGTHIVFTNRRAEVERYTDLTRRAAERVGCSVELLAHHGNLSKDVREQAEQALRTSSRATIFSTTSLELGIDVGAVESIAQIGPPPSVASLRQRLGRSGRAAGEPSIIRLFIEEFDLGPDPAPQDQLREGLLQAIAMVELLIDGWNEPPPHNALHLSTLVQQTLSLAAQYGGFKAQDAWRLLCAQGPFGSVSTDQFGRLLRCMAAHDLIVQDHDGTIVLGLAGERLVSHYEFYAAFTSPEEYRLVADGRTLGTLPIIVPLISGQFLIFAGQRWEILHVDDRRKVVELAAAPGGKPPSFSGQSSALVHERVRLKMRSLLETSEVPRYLDNRAKDYLRDARAAYAALRLRELSILQHRDETIIFPWTGDRATHTILLALDRAGLDPAIDKLSIAVRESSRSAVTRALETTFSDASLTAHELAAAARNKETEKYHCYLDEKLLTHEYAAARVDLDGARRSVAKLLSAGV